MFVFLPRVGLPQRHSALRPFLPSVRRVESVVRRRRAINGRSKHLILATQLTTRGRGSEFRACLAL